MYKESLILLGMYSIALTKCYTKHSRLFMNICMVLVCD